VRIANSADLSEKRFQSSPQRFRLLENIQESQ
jgi:hypothetical protein